MAIFTRTNSPDTIPNNDNDNDNDDTKTYLPLPPPDSLYSENPQQKLIEAEQEKYDAVFSHFNNPEYKLPGFEDSDGVKERLEEMKRKEGLQGERREWTAELVEEEKFWLSYECMLRYLRASKWKTQAAIERLENTLKWRREFGIYDLITSEYISVESETGKAFVFGHDIKGRPGFYMYPNRQNTEEGPKQIHFTVWVLERCVDMMPPGVENLAIMLNFSFANRTTSFSQSRTVLSILQDHYPERMGTALIINLPFLITTFFKMILPFVDPVTREKVKFNPDVVKENLVPKERLVKEGWGGERDLVYVHERFFGRMVEMGEERRGRWMGKWRELGAGVGVREWDYKRE